MPAPKTSKVDYLRVYPGLNDFSDALASMPETVVKHMEALKEIDARYTLSGRQISQHISSFFSSRSPEKLKQLLKLLDEFNTVMTCKVNAVTWAAEEVQRQSHRLELDYDMIRANEIPQKIQYDFEDPSFVPIVPQQQQASARAQARREAREAREARRAIQQQQQLESRSSTPAASEPPQPARRRGRVAASARFRGVEEDSQKLQFVPAHIPATTNTEINANNTHATPTEAPHEPSQPLQPQATDSLLSAAEAISEDVKAKPNPESDSSSPSNSPSGSDHAGLPSSPHGSEPASPTQNGNIEIPPVVMPLATEEPGPVDDAEADHAGVKRKRGLAPRSTEPVYCYCQQGSFGEMVGCDGPSCEREWFHLDCIGLSALPKGQWFCADCRTKLRKR